jgi:hypothetical protein
VHVCEHFTCQGPSCILARNPFRKSEGGQGCKGRGRALQKSSSGTDSATVLDLKVLIFGLKIRRFHRWYINLPTHWWALPEGLPRKPDREDEGKVIVEFAESVQGMSVY